MIPLWSEGGIKQEKGRKTNGRPARKRPEKAHEVRKKGKIKKKFEIFLKKF